MHCSIAFIWMVAQYSFIRRHSLIFKRAPVDLGPVFGRITISQTKQITTSSDAQLKDEHDELTTIAWRFIELVAEPGLQWRSMIIDEDNENWC